jgi:hypothetical protein
VNVCASCKYISIGKYPSHEKLGIYRCTRTGSFYVITRPHACVLHEMFEDLEARRKLYSELLREGK